MGDRQTDFDERAVALSAERLGHRYDMMVRRRALLLAIHFILAIAVAAAFMSQMNYSHFAYWSRGESLLVRPLLGCWPYIPSAVLCYRRAIIGWIQFAIYALALVITTALVVAIYVGSLHLDLEGLSAELVPVSQCFLLTVAGAFLTGGAATARQAAYSSSGARSSPDSK